MFEFINFRFLTNDVELSGCVDGFCGLREQYMVRNYFVSEEELFVRFFSVQITIICIPSVSTSCQENLLFYKLELFREPFNHIMALYWKIFTNDECITHPNFLLPIKHYFLYLLNAFLSYKIANAQTTSTPIFTHQSPQLEINKLFHLPLFILMYTNTIDILTWLY